MPIPGHCPNRRWWSGRASAKGEIEEDAETKVPECAVELGAVLEGTREPRARDLKVGGGATASRLDIATEAAALLQGQAALRG